jgi:hypothetical protein
MSVCHGCSIRDFYIDITVTKLAWAMRFAAGNTLRLRSVIEYVVLAFSGHNLPILYGKSQVGTGLIEAEDESPNPLNLPGFAIHL